MKRIFLAAFLIIATASLTNNANATASSFVSLKDGIHISPSQVPPAVMQAFAAKFPTATNARWEKEQEHGGTVYKVDFYKSGIRWRAVFASDGTLLKSERH